MKLKKFHKEMFKLLNVPNSEIIGVGGFSIVCTDPLNSNEVYKVSLDSSPSYLTQYNYINDADVMDILHCPVTELGSIGELFYMPWHKDWYNVHLYKMPRLYPAPIGKMPKRNATKVHQYKKMVAALRYNPRAPFIKPRDVDAIVDSSLTSWNIDSRDYVKDLLLMQDQYITLDRKYSFMQDIRGNIYLTDPIFLIALQNQLYGSKRSN